MGNRSRSYPKRKESLLTVQIPTLATIERDRHTPEEVQKRTEELRRRQRVRTETEATHDGRPNVGLIFDPLLDALIKEHPEKDPANIK